MWGVRMKFSEVTEQQWDELKEYFDTCLLPFTGLRGGESPIEATKALERLRDALELIEVPFKGRVITYPAYHFQGLDSGGTASSIDELCIRLKQEVGFSYIIIVCVDDDTILETCHHADLILKVEVDETGVKTNKKEVQAAVQKMWQSE